MKKMFLAAIIALGAFNLSCSDDDNGSTDKIIEASELPAAARTFVETYFPAATYTRVEKQSRADSDGSVYDVHLSNGFEIDFTAEGEWTDIDGGMAEVPAGIIPAPISAYVAENYSGSFITTIEIERYGYDVELSNDVDLVFNAEGEFVRVDR
jgi:hypothetical protein